MFINFRGKQIPVTVSDPPKWEEALETNLITNWLNSLDSTFNLKSIELQSVDRFASGRVGFVKIKATLEINNKIVDRVILLRGAAVTLLLEITDEDTNEKWTVLVKQPRVPTGESGFLEIPAGMVDGTTGDFRGIAIKELEEECGIHANAKDLIDLTQLAYGDEYPGIYFVGYVSDEYLRFYLWKTKLPHDEIVRINGRIGGEDEHEQIVLKLVKFEEAEKITSDTKLLVALALMNGLKSEGKLP